MLQVYLWKIKKTQKEVETVTHFTQSQDSTIDPMNGDMHIVGKDDHIKKSP